jgi:hypothetical protein
MIILEQLFWFVKGWVFEEITALAWQRQSAKTEPGWAGLPLSPYPFAPALVSRRPQASEAGGHGRSRKENIFWCGRDLSSQIENK